MDQVESTTLQIEAPSDLTDPAALTSAAAAGVTTSPVGVSNPAEARRTADVEAHRRELIRALSRGTSLPNLVADTTQLDLRQACRVTKIALEEDADFDKKLVAIVKSGAASTPDQIVRVLTVLESVCPPSRLLAHLLGLKHLEGRVRSKITLMVGRLTRDPTWLRSQLEDENPRVRANAVEGLWDVRAEGLEDLLQAAVHDPHHRVAANAALALYKIGDVTSIEKIYALLRHQGEMFRRAGLWVAGQSRDPRFIPPVEEIAGRASGDEALMARRVGDELRSSRASSEFTAALSLELKNDSVNASGTRCVSVCCIAGSVSGWLGPDDLTAVNFAIIDGERQIEKYRTHWVAADMPFTALIVIPRSWNGNFDLMKPALRGAGRAEVYGFVPYQTPYSLIRGKERDDRLEVKFENYLEMSKDYLNRKYEVAKSLGVAIQSGLDALSSLTGSRHLFVLADPSVGDAGAFAETFHGQSGISVHSVVWDHATPELHESLRSLSKRFNGHYIRAVCAKDFTRTLISVRAEHFGVCEISWTPPDTTWKSSVRIVCNSDYGFGELVVPKAPPQRPTVE